MKNAMLIYAILLIVNAYAYSTQILLYENFEDGVLDPRISVSTVGSFNSWPGIKDLPLIEGNKSFGFGRSTNRYNS